MQETPNVLLRMLLLMLLLLLLLLLLLCSFRAPSSPYRVPCRLTLNEARPIPRRGGLEKKGNEGGGC